MSTLRILWLALFASTFLYLVVIAFVSPPPAAPETGLIAFVLGLVALTTGGASLVVPELLYRAALARESFEVEEVPAPDASIIRGEPTSTVRVFADPAAALRVAHERFRAPFIVGCALAESTAIFGLVLAFMGIGIATVLPFFVASWLLFAWRFPRTAMVTAPLEREANARLSAG